MNSVDMRGLIRLGRIALKTASEMTDPRDMANYWALITRAEMYALKAEEDERYAAQQAKEAEKIAASAAAREINDKQEVEQAAPSVPPVITEKGGTTGGTK